MGWGMGEGWSWTASRPCRRTFRFSPTMAPEPSLTSRSAAEKHSMASSEEPVDSEALEVGSGGGSVSARPFRLFLRRRARHRALACLAVIRWPCAPRRAATVAQEIHKRCACVASHERAVACHNLRSSSALHLGAQGASSPSRGRPVQRPGQIFVRPGEIGNPRGVDAARGVKRRWA